MTGMVPRWVESDGLRLAVYERGDRDAPTIVLVHGYPDNASVWDGVAALLAERFHVVTYDVRGHGRSDAPNGRAGYRMELLVGDLKAVIGALGGGPVHLVGHDWGSVQAWAALDPELVRSFTSISGPDLGHVAAWARGWRRRPGAVARQATRSWYIGAFQLPGLAEGVWRIPTLRRRFSADYRDAANGLQLYRANTGRGRPRRITLPVQQLVLTQDPFLTPALAEAADPWCTDLYRRELVAGHWAPRTHPDAVARAVREFVLHVDGETTPRALTRARVGDSGQPPLAGQLALVTGAGSGIGLATATALAGQGAQVLCVDIDFGRAEEAARRIGGLAFQLDVADAGATDALARHVLAEHGVPDLVMANAGIGVSGSFLDTSLDDWRRVVDVNLWGVIHTLHAFLPAMVERGEGGHVVVTSSAAGYFATPFLPAYATTKAGVLMLAQCLDGELRSAGIGVSAICPGFVHTNIAATARFAGTGPEEERRRRARAEALYRRRAYGPEKVAAAVLAAVRDGRLVVPVTPEAHLGAWATRFTPAAARALGRRLATETGKRTS